MLPIKTVVHAFIACRLDWCNSLLYCMPKYLLRRRDHITSVLRQLHWLPVQRRVEFQIACLVHQSLASTAPTYLSADIRLISEHGRPHLCSSFHRTPVVPWTRISFGDRNFAAVGTRVEHFAVYSIRQMTKCTV